MSCRSVWCRAGQSDVVKMLCRSVWCCAGCSDVVQVVWMSCRCCAGPSGCCAACCDVVEVVLMSYRSVWCGLLEIPTHEVKPQTRLNICKHEYGIQYVHIARRLCDKKKLDYQFSLLKMEILKWTKVLGTRLSSFIRWRWVIAIGHSLSKGRSMAVKLIKITI
jgi:hypothetical protein